MNLSELNQTTRAVAENAARQRPQNRPRIGVTMFSGREQHKFYTKVQYNYVQSIYDAGGIPVLIPTLRDLDQGIEYAATIDALMLTGGEDISPLTFDEQPRFELGPTDLQRDRWELALLAACEARDMPILGICRGLQIMNVHRGGTLYQDIRAETGSTLGHGLFQDPMESLHHSIAIESGSQLATIFEQRELIVNSFHHQGLRDLGRNLIATARATDKVIEGAEDPARAFYLGVQFHAEALPPLDAYYLRIFSALVGAAKQFSTQQNA